MAGKIRARVIADSINPSRIRLTTVEATFNRYILAEVNTYREWSRNSASSRAIPVKKVLSQVWNDPATPIHWGANQAGMQAHVQLFGWRKFLARRLFLWARIPVLVVVWLLSKLKLHKQVTNRLLEPWVWHTAIITSTNWENMLKQRDHKDAQPEFQVLARCIRSAIEESTPQEMEWGQWHQPYLISDDWVAAAQSEMDKELLVPTTVMMSAARCAAVSYVRQGEKRDPYKDVELAQRLAAAGHWSPFEHVAIAERDHVKDSNFDASWKQLRKFYPGEDGRNAVR